MINFTGGNCQRKANFTGGKCSRKGYFYINIYEALSTET